VLPPINQSRPKSTKNLIRRELTPAQRAKLIAQRKGAYQKAHPAAKTGGAPGKLAAVR
jgi:hypothetical protein